MANSASTEGAGAAGAHGEGGGRRDFLFLAGGALGAFATGASVWPMLDSLNPAKDTLAASTTNVDLSPIEEGQAITVKWRGSPVFIRRRTTKEIAEAKAVKPDDLPDPQTDEQRFGGGAREQWLVVVGVCTHLGCIPLGQKGTDNKGEFGGWFCPCHGSHYDISGRIRKGPAPRNLPVPPYTITAENKLIIGKEQPKGGDSGKTA